MDWIIKKNIRVFTVVVGKCIETNLYIGFVSGFSGAHSQAETLDELNSNLREVIEMLVEMKASNFLNCKKKR